MRLLHYHKNHLTQIHSVEQSANEERLMYGVKPNGLWVSVEGADDWPSWCRSEDFALERLECVTEVVLKKKNTILKITTDDALMGFTDEYGFSDPRRRGITAIDWVRIAEKHDGIIITPYNWKRRLCLEANWYYSWDCASGCIWNSRAVKELRPVPCSSK